MSLKYSPSSATKKPKNGTISVPFYLPRNPLNVRHFRRHQVTRTKRQMIVPLILLHHSFHKTTHKPKEKQLSKESIKDFMNFSNVHCQDFLMQLFNSLIICLFLHVTIYLFDFFFLWRFLFVYHLNFLFGHWNPFKVTWDALFCKSWKMNLVLPFVRSYFWRIRTCLFF